MHDQKNSEEKSRQRRGRVIGVHAREERNYQKISLKECSATPVRRQACTWLPGHNPSEYFAYSGPRQLPGNPGSGSPAATNVHASPSFQSVYITRARDNF